MEWHTLPPRRLSVESADRRTVQVYDIASDHWELGPQLPLPNNHGMAAGVNGQIYLIGGRTQADDPPGTNSFLRGGTRLTSGRTYRARVQDALQLRT